MKIVISKTDLVNLISKIQSVVSTKPAIPILSNFLLEAIDDQLILSATDLTVSIRCFSDAKVLEEGAIALPARRFLQLIRELTSTQVKISSLSDDVAETAAGTSIFRINGMQKSEFPNLPDLTNAPQISFKSSALKKMLANSCFSTSKDDNRYVLNGVLLRVLDKKATFLATDGKRLSKVSTEVDLDPSFQGSYVIPLKAAEEMIRTLDGDESEAALTLMHDKIALEQGNLTLISKLLSGKYPEVEKVIPENPNHVITLHREELISLLRQVSLFTSDNTNSVRFSFEPGKLRLTAVSSEFGEGDVDMAVDYSGETLQVAFNPYYFQDILRHSTDETIQFGITDPYNPGRITDSTNSVFVIMPMHLQEVEKISSSQEDSVDQDAALTQLS